MPKENLIIYKKNNNSNKPNWFIDAIVHSKNKSLSHGTTISYIGQPDKLVLYLSILFLITTYFTCFVLVPREYHNFNIYKSIGLAILFTYPVILFYYLVENNIPIRYLIFNNEHIIITGMFTKSDIKKNSHFSKWSLMFEKVFCYKECDIVDILIEQNIIFKLFRIKKYNITITLLNPLEEPHEVSHTYLGLPYTKSKINLILVPYNKVQALLQQINVLTILDEEKYLGVINKNSVDINR